MSTTNHDKAVEVAKKWLREKHTTLWMDWDLTTEDGLHDAAEWFITNMEHLLDFHESEMEAGLDW